METKLQMIKEIKPMERELYLKRIQIASDKAKEHGVTLLALVGQDLDPKKLEGGILRIGKSH